MPFKCRLIENNPQLQTQLDENSQIFSLSNIDLSEVIILETEGVILKAETPLSGITD